MANDIDRETLELAKRRCHFPGLLDELVGISRKEFGWFTKHLPRSFEYPWVAAHIEQPAGKKILDIGAGVSPLPLYFAAKGAKVTTVDFSPIIREKGKGEKTWNEWGFLDYHTLHSGIDSHNCDVCTLEFPKRSFDVVYSVSVLEHVPAEARRRIFSRIAEWLRPGGDLLLTIDVHPLTQVLWNRNQGMTVEEPTIHGTLAGMVHELRGEGFSLVARQSLRDLPQTAVDCIFLHFVKNGLSSSGRLDGQAEEKRRRIESTANRVAFACVADCQPKFLDQTLRLLQSVRWCGGTLADADFYIGMVERIDPDYLKRLEELNAFVFQVDRFSKLHGPSNKLQILRLPELRQYETVVLLDCDTVVVRDPSEYLRGTAFRAKIADLATVPHDVFAGVFDRYQMKLPDQCYRTNPGGQPTIWYCNSGVLVMPAAVLSTLGPKWLEWNRRLLKDLDALGERRYFCDQASLSLAFADCPVPYQELPIEMNYPLHLTADQCPRLKEDADPVIIHYHNEVSPLGYLKPAQNPQALRRVDAYNARVLEERRKRFDNCTFWNFRYTHAPELGSGVGSRGETAEYKRNLLRNLVQRENPERILDIGCGDLAVSSALPEKGYVGVDVSRVVVERNAQAHPGRRFMVASLLDPDCVLPTSDLVLCLDVLIHIDSAEDYRKFVQRITTFSQGCCVISGYDSTPGHVHDMTFYHEPLSKTLSDFGFRYLTKVGEYPHGITVFLARRRRPFSARGIRSSLRRLKRIGASLLPTRLKAL